MLLEAKLVDWDFEGCTAAGIFDHKIWLSGKIKNGVF